MRKGFKIFTLVVALAITVIPPAFMTFAALDHNPQDVYLAIDGTWQWDALAPMTLSWLVVGLILAGVWVGAAFLLNWLLSEPAGTRT